jgi:multisubunit Na+/H+ antiporter MnhC subunit
MNPYVTLILILVGMYGLISSTNIIKSVFMATLIESGVILLFLNYQIPFHFHTQRMYHR